MNRHLRRTPDSEGPDQAQDRGAGKLIKSLRALAQAESDCRRCPLYRDATQAVPGEGTEPGRLHAGRRAAGR